MVTTVVFICFFLIQYLVLIECQIIRVDSCKRDTNLEDVLFQMKEMRAETDKKMMSAERKHQEELSKLRALLMETENKMNSSEREQEEELSKMREMLIETENKMNNTIRTLQEELLSKMNEMFMETENKMNNIERKLRDTMDRLNDTEQLLTTIGRSISI